MHTCMILAPIDVWLYCTVVVPYEVFVRVSCGGVTILACREAMHSWTQRRAGCLPRLQTVVVGSMTRASVVNMKTTTQTSSPYHAEQATVCNPLNRVCIDSLQIAALAIMTHEDVV